MSFTRAIPAVVLSAVALTNAAGGVIFQDNFDAENGGNGALNYAAFGHWNVSAGTVDLIGNGAFDYYPGNGLYIDLDGSTFDSGLFSSITLNLAAGDYVLEFDLGGRPDGGTNSVDVTLGSAVNASFSLGDAVPLTSFSIPFTLAGAESASINFQDSGNDNFGLILDNVRLSLVPAPSSAAFLVVPVLAVARRRR